MSSTCCVDSLVDIDSSILKTTKQSTKTIFAAPKMAESLRPNTEELALACMAGDEEAIAVTEAWRFHTSRATRLVVLPFDDPSFSHVTTFERVGGGSLPTAAPKRRTLEVETTDLESAYSEFQPHAGETHTSLWTAIEEYCRRFARRERQGSIRKVGWEDDLVNELTMHVFEQTMRSKFGGRAKYSWWVGAVCRNYCSDSLNELTAEKKVLKLIEGNEPEEGEEREVGYIWESQLPDGGRWNSERGNARLSAKVENVIEALENPADRAYARFMALGFNQKDAAFEMCESSVTARTRERRIRKALQTAGLGVTIPVVMA